MTHFQLCLLETQVFFQQVLHVAKKSDLHLKPIRLKSVFKIFLKIIVKYLIYTSMYSIQLLSWTVFAKYMHFEGLAKSYHNHI